MKPVLLALALVAAACGGKSNPAPTPTPTPTPVACVAGGCSGHLCIAEDSPSGITTCEFRDEYACYQGATCARQPDGACGWSPTPELEACLANPPPPQ
jgi:hypothetical protein